MTNRQALWAVIITSTLLRVAWGASLGPDTNEAYHFLYTRHPDLSYFDHPPMVALVAALGLKLARGVSLVLSLRAAFIVLFAGSSWLMAKLTSRFYGPMAGVLAALALNVAGYFGLVVGTFAEPDGPLLFFWILTLDRLAVALASPERLWSWLGVGLAWGGALLSKYHAVLLPVGAGLYLILWPAARRCLRTPGPYLALAVGLVLFAPVIGWNATHAWVSFLFQGLRAVPLHRAMFQLDRLAEAVIAQVLFLFPWIWAALMRILVRLIRRGPRDWMEGEAFLACHAVPAFALFLGVSTFRHIMPSWPLIGFIAVMPMLGRDWSDRLADRPEQQWRRLAAMTMAPVAVAVMVSAHSYFGLFQASQGWPLGLVAPGGDPTLDPILWDQVARKLERRHLLDEPGTFLFTSDWRDSAQLGFATQGRVPVACFVRDSRSFTYWSRPEDWVGRDGIFVGSKDGPNPVNAYARFFDRIEPLGAFNVVRASVPVRTVRLFRCVRQTRAFPFGYSSHPGP